MNNGVTALVPSFLIGSSLFLQATRTLIKALMGLKFDRIRPGTYALRALVRLENPHRLIMEKICDHSSAFNFEWIFLILADKKDNYQSLDEFKYCQDPITYYAVSAP